MDNTTHQVRLAQWIEIVEACNRRPKGMTARQWLNDNSISEKTYYYWQRRVRKEVLSQSIDTVPAVSAKNEITFAEIQIRLTLNKRVPIHLIRYLIVLMLMPLLNVGKQLLLCPTQYLMQCSQRYWRWYHMLAEAAGVSRIVIACGLYSAYFYPQLFVYVP